MSDAGNIPRIKPVRRGRRIAIGVLVAVIVGIVSLFRETSVFYTDFLWFRSVHLTSVWSGLLGVKIALALASSLFFFVLLWVNLWVVDRNAPRTIVFSPEDEIARQYQRFVRPRAKRVRTAVAAVLGLLGGAGFYSHWSEWLLFRNGTNFGTDDPQFGKDVGFFMFKLPFISTVLDWVFYAVLFAVFVSLVGHYLQGAIRPQATTSRVTSTVKAHLSILLGVLALVRAGQYWVERYQLSFSKRGVVSGANYTDVHFTLPALVMLVLISLLAAVLFVIGSRQRKWTWPVATVALWAVVSLLVGTIIPAAVQKFRVEPAESQKEAPYIERNIEATRAALNLNAVKVSDFDYSNKLDGEQLKDNAQTIRNVRLWDPTLLQPSYKRLQETRSFFTFDDIDIDRYPIDGQTTQMMLSVRQLNLAGLPSDRRSWVNQHLAYTHGYGAVASPANAVSTAGGPEFTLKDVPPTGSPSVQRPQVYFGERRNDYSIVNTKQAEVDYVANTGNDITSRYEGSGGVPLDNIAKRAAFAARVGDINPLISGLVTSKSKAMYLTDISDRAKKAAPFLSYDADPYPVVIEGRIKWVQDAYTTSNAYPYAEAADTSQVQAGSGLDGKAFNYVRNSVKVVTDAYDGTMTFYVVDTQDPVIKVWQKAFPKLFTDGARISSELRQHLRYPEDLFRVQSKMFGSYHLTKAEDFYSKSDRWNIAQRPNVGVGTSSSTTVPAGTPAANTVARGEDRIEPYYLLMRLPGEQQESFLMFQPFVPFSQNDSRKELSAFMVAKSDPDSYGQLQAYVMPRDQQIPGPALVEARIQSEPSISQYITLLNQAGSRVDLGNLLIIPVDNSLLYIQPLYVTARQTQIPEFKKAIVVQGDRIAMEDTLQASLIKIFGSAPSTLEQRQAGSSTGTPAPGAQTGTPTPPGGGTATTAPTSPTSPTSSIPLSPEAQALFDQAIAEWTQADEALKNGDLGSYQDHVKKGMDLVRRARG